MGRGFFRISNQFISDMGKKTKAIKVTHQGKPWEKRKIATNMKLLEEPIKPY